MGVSNRPTRTLLAVTSYRFFRVHRQRSPGRGKSVFCSRHLKYFTRSMAIEILQIMKRLDSLKQFRNDSVECFCVASLGDL